MYNFSRFLTPPFPKIVWKTKSSGGLEWFCSIIHQLCIFSNKESRKKNFNNIHFQLLYHFFKLNSDFSCSKNLLPKRVEKDKTILFLLSFLDNKVAGNKIVSFYWLKNFWVPKTIPFGSQKWLFFRVPKMKKLRKPSLGDWQAYFHRPLGISRSEGISRF